MEAETRAWLGEKIGRHCLENLKKHGFDAHMVDTPEAAGEWVLERTADLATFGFGGSDSVRALGLVEALRERGKTVYDHWEAGLSPERIAELRLLQGRCDCFLCSANGISADGQIVNVDGIGNRTSAMAFGPRRVIVVAGVNKIAPDLHAALRRVREVAAPMRARSLKMDTPCARTGICSDCNTPQRICNITTILHRKPMQTDLRVLLVNAPLGF